MTKSKQRAAIAFRLVCLLFSAALAVATLLSGIDLTAESERLSARRAELQALEQENESLRARAACAVSLEELEDYAIRVLGMQHCEPGQITVLELPEER